MLTVILYHRFILLCLTPIYSIATLFEKAGSTAGSLVDLNTRSVDGFFLMGGTVLSYSFFQKYKDRSQFSPIRFYVDRYLRMVPSLAVMILYQATLLIHSGHGPVWRKVAGSVENSCNKLWWTGLLQVKNYMDHSCVAQSWYVSCDFQLYLMSPLFLLPLLERPRTGLLLLAGVSLASVVAATAYAYVVRLSTGVIWSEFSRDRNTEMTDSMVTYEGFHFRIPTFCMGIALGYLLFTVKKKKHDLKLTELYVLLGWLASVTVLVGIFSLNVILGSPEHVFSPWVDPLYFGLSRTLFCASMSWVILACTLGHGGVINRFLSWSGFRPLAKLTYGVFLVHTTVIYKQIFSVQDTFVLSFVDNVYLLGGDVIISFALAVVIHLAVEVPCCRLTSYLLSDKKHK